MRVAIVGGGLAGIVCAMQLEREGIIADIFERNKALAEPYRHVGAMLQIVLRPVKDPLSYLAQTHGIEFKPLARVKRIIHSSPSVTTAITGNLGYFLSRGAIDDSIENQLAANLKSRVHLNTEIDYKKLRNRYDYIVVATGYPWEARALGIWKDIIKMSVKGAVISGDFDTEALGVWLNKDYCKAGYAYLAPFSRKEATLVLAVNDIRAEELDEYWDCFLHTEGIKNKVLEYFVRDHYAGFVYPHRIGNVFFIGNAGGVLDPLLGFGVFNSVISASEAAKSMIYNTDYEAGIKSALKTNKKLFEFRKTLNRLDNNGYDFFFRLIGLPGVNPVVYNTNLNVLNLAYSVLKPVNALLGLINGQGGDKDNK